MPPPNASQQALLTMSRAILERATAPKELLVKLSMSEQVLEELSTALGQYEQSLEATSAGRRAHVGAGADLETVATEISEQVRLLDKVVQYRFGDDSEPMAAWDSARNVVGPGAVKNEPNEGGTVTPKAA